MDKSPNFETDYNLLITLLVFFISAGGFIYILISAMQIISEYAQAGGSADSFSSFMP
jgi:hypothetical protein